jgi:catechol 2,3-dioxygenase-like lactoylglutathione lyase family enzyme
MRVLGYTWAGVRTADLESAARFFAGVLGFSVIHKGEGLIQFKMPSGQLFEVFDSRSRYYQLHACPVLAFQVEDVRTAKRSWSHAASSSSQMSMATNQRAGLIFEHPTATSTSFGKRLAL